MRRIWLVLLASSSSSTNNSTSVSSSGVGGVEARGRRGVSIIELSGGDFFLSAVWRGRVDDGATRLKSAARKSELNGKRGEGDDGAR